MWIRACDLFSKGNKIIPFGYGLAQINHSTALYEFLPIPFCWLQRFRLWSRYSTFPSKFDTKLEQAYEAGKEEGIKVGRRQGEKESLDRFLDMLVEKTKEKYPLMVSRSDTHIGEIAHDIHNIDIGDKIVDDNGRMVDEEMNNLYG